MKKSLAMLLILTLLVGGIIFTSIKFLGKSAQVDVNKNIDDPYKTKKRFKIEVVEGNTFIDGYLIVNKTYPIREDFIPSNTHKTITNDWCPECLDKETYEAFLNMKSDASKEGLNLWIASGYRGYTYQKKLYDAYTLKHGKEEADTFSARPGYSEHQTGLAFDLNTVNDAFADSKEGIWINNNASKYGFILRYPKGKEASTGYKYEPWHLRYVGTDLSNKLYKDENWTTLEEYFGITSEYKQK